MREREREWERERYDSQGKGVRRNGTYNAVRVNICERHVQGCFRENMQTARTRLFVNICVCILSECVFLL